MGFVVDAIFGEGDSTPTFAPNPGAQDARDALFPDGAPGLPEAPVVEFDPSFILQGLEFFQQQADKAINFATENFQQAETFQRPFFNQAQGFKGLSQGVLGGQFDPRNDANAFTFDPSDPEFQFQLQRGEEGIDAGASARGLLASGSRIQDKNAFAQGLANQFAGDVLNRRLAVGQTNMGNLATLAGIEQSAANNLSNINTGLGQLGAGVFSGLGSGGLSALSQAAGLQNATALANASNALSAQNSTLGAFTGLSGAGTFGPPPPDRFGQVLGTIGSVAPFFFI